MFKLIGFIIGVGLMLLAAIAWMDKSQAKKITAQLHTELDQAIENVAQPPLEFIAVANQTSTALSGTVQGLVDEVQNHSTAPAIPLKEVQQLIPEEIENTAWHIFWEPFTKRQSAQGFATRLSQQTGIEISVVSDETQHYRVNFSYLDEADKLRILMLIKEKTGLEVIK